MSRDDRVMLEAWLVGADFPMAPVVRRLLDEVDRLRAALDQDGHRVILAADGWSIEHPVECRPEMHKCPVHVAMQAWRRSAFPRPGYYKVSLPDGPDGALHFEDVPAQ